ncbi:MAG: hypothetical protein ACKN86_02355 [Crocinitomicaceae bacterium]
MKNLLSNLSFLTLLILPLLCGAQSRDFKGYFFVRNNINQKGVEVDSVKDVFLKTKKGTFFIKDCREILSKSDNLHLKKVIVRGEILRGELDLCDKNSIQQSRIGEHISLEDLVMESSFSYTLSDGSGNRYSLDGNSLTYLPVSKEMSSSGMYDGGVKKEKVLSENERIMLIRNFRKTLKKTRPLLCSKGRPMGSIAISFSQLGEDKEYCCEENKKWKWFIGRNKLLLD